MIDPSTLALGGLAAVLAGFWSQARSIFSYLSSFIVVTAHIDGGATTAVRIYLKTKYKVVPSGSIFFSVCHFKLRDKSDENRVPFQALSANTIFYRGWKLLLVSHSANGIVLRSLRGFIDYQKLLSDALDYHQSLNSLGSHTNRFSITDFIGEEKGNWGPHGRTSTGDSPAEPIQANTDNNSMPIDFCVDTSFKYTKDMYELRADEDAFSNLYYDQDVLRYIDQAKQWMSMGEWYTQRGIPWRRGWLLHGKGGTGKSSLARAVAQDLKLPIYRFFLSTLSDQEFVRKWSRMSVPCIALFEDFDAVFNKRESQTEHKSLTFDCVLNQISGVSTVHGVFLMITTNRLDYIDEAMGVSFGHNGLSTRPGRIDTVIEVGNISKENRTRMARQVLCDWPELIPSLVDESDGMTPIQFQEICIQKAYDKLQLHFVPTV